MSGNAVSPFAKKKLDDGWARNNTKLINAIQSIGQKKEFGKLGIALVNLTGSKRAFAGHNPSKQFRVGSLVKIGVMYAAYQLRFAANDSVIMTNSKLTPKELFSELNKSWKQAIDAPIGEYKLGTLSYPSLGEIFKATTNAKGHWNVDFTSMNGGSSQITNSEFEQLNNLHKIKDTDSSKRLKIKKLGFLAKLKLVAAWSDNTAADLCIETLGLKYILKALEAVGLLEINCQPTNDPNKKTCVGRGMWVGSTYVPPEKALSTIPGGEGTLSSNAEHVAKFLTLLHFNELVNRNSSEDMKAIMRWSGSWFRDSLKNHPKGSTKDFYSKDGLNRIAGVYSECAVVERKYTSHQGLYIASVVGAASANVLERLIVQLDDIMAANP